MSVANAHQFSFTTIDGDTLNLSDLKGNVIMVVNTASKCGLTPQYAALQSLYDNYKEQGFIIIGVPSDNFGGQEFKDESDVKTFTNKEFSITFPLTSLNHVIGKEAHPFYQWANEKAGFLGSPKWNFHKYLIGKNGEFLTWFSSTTTPKSDKIITAIESALASE